MAAKKPSVRCRGRVGRWPADARCTNRTTSVTGLCPAHRPKKTTKEAT